MVSLSGSYPGAPQFGNLRGENPVAEDSPLHAHSGIGSRAIGAGTTVHGIGTILHQPVGQLVSSVSWAPQRGNLRGEDPVAEDSLLHAQGRGGEQGRTRGHSRRAWSPHFSGPHHASQSVCSTRDRGHYRPQGGRVFGKDGMGMGVGEGEGVGVLVGNTGGPQGRDNRDLPS